MSIKAAIKKVVSKCIRIGYSICCKHIKIDNKTIMFIAYHGKGYLCNPKAVHKELLKDEKFKDYNFIWAISGRNLPEVAGAKVVRYNGVKYFYYLAKSKYWIFNCKMPKYIIKKEGQVYIQTWHGTPLKRLAHDIQLSNDATFYRSKVTRDEMVKSYDIDAAKYNYLLSPNRFSTERFESCFRVNRERIVETGYPRNDFLANLTEIQIDEIKDKLGIDKNKKVLLYAPTWRDNQFNAKGYSIKVKADFDKWKEALGEEWIILVKPHYLIVNAMEIKEEKGRLMLLDDKYDINELYAISDIMITDYSSVFFDYSILNRPILFYMYDLNEYKDELRGFYLDIYKDLPGPIIENEDELLNNLITGKYKEFEERRKEFINRFNYLDDGKAAKRVIELIK